MKELCPGRGQASKAPPSRRGEGCSTWRARSLGIFALLAGLGSAPAGPAPGQMGLDDSWACRNEPPYWIPLSDLWLLPSGVRAVTVEERFVLEPGAPPDRARRFFLEDDRGLGGKIELLPYAALGGRFRDDALTLIGSRLEVTGCLEQRPPKPKEPASPVLRFYRYAEIPERERHRPPREVELSSLRDGAFDGQRVRVRGALGGRRHGALPLATRLSESDWVLASGNAAAWMRGHAPEGEGFSLDPDDGDDHGWGLAVVGVVAWWRDAPSLHVESVVLSGPRPESPVAVLFTLPLDDRLDAAEPTIEVRFNAPMDESSFDGRVELLDASGEPVPARWVYDDTLWRLLVSPADTTAANAELVLRLRTGVLSASGHNVRSEADAAVGLLLMRRFRVP